MELLWINCCISGKENSRTYKLSKEFLEKYKPEENLEVVEIDLITKTTAFEKGRH